MIDIYNALIQRLTTSSITDIDASDIAYDNADFDPKDKDAWLSTNFIPVERGGSSKTALSAEDTGLFQVDDNLSCTWNNIDNTIEELI